MASSPVERSTPINIDRAAVAAKRERLEQARRELKSFFIGIDRVIDDLCDAVAIWYVMPEVIARPVIVNLWGMTGVGKTDLIRRLVKHLDIQERFVEIELSNNDSTTMQSSVAQRLMTSGALEGEPTLLLFDEIQRFHTIDGDGNPLPQTKFSDFWELLSDGRLSRRESQDYELLISGMVMMSRNMDRRRAAGEEVTDDAIGPWEAQNLKRVYGVKGDLSELEGLTYRQALDHMLAARQSKRIYEPIDCSRCLVIVSGNLDEAFTMASATAEADVDADIFHAFTSKITLVDIKTALVRRFKPEQVARFGNIHVIYTSLRRRDFEELIRREIEAVCRRTTEAFGVTVNIDPTVHALVYRNGVFPVQGVRPMFSSVADIVSTNMAKLLFEAVMNDAPSISLAYDEASRELVGRVGDVESRIPYAGRVDRIRHDALVDKVANVAVHESGHAAAYGLLFGLAPLQLTSRVASTYVGGFTFPHQIYETSESMLNQVKVLLAGGIAEELVFGMELASVGRNADRERASMMIIDFVRRYGFDREFQANYMLDLQYAMDRSVPEPDIEKMMTRLVAETRQLLSQHRALVMELALQLADRGKLTSGEVAVVMGGRGIPVDVRPEGFQWIPPYRQTLQQPS